MERGGLAVFCWAPLAVTTINSSHHFVLCKIVSNNGKHFRMLFLYGELCHHLHPQRWHELSALLSTITNYLIIGVIN